MTFSTFSSAAGDWALKIARTIAVAMMALVPVQFFMRGDGGGILMGVAIALVFVVGILCIVARRFWPFAVALVAIILHGLCMYPD